jgi:hypothetical protein
MKLLPTLALLFSLLLGPALGQDRPVSVSLIQLIANPDKFDGALVSVRGYLLRMGGNHDIAAHLLFLHKEDAENELGNSVLVVPSDQMRRDQEKILRMYVTLVGTYHLVPVAGEDIHTSGVIKEVRSCIVWSNPNRPIGERQNNDTKPKR